MSDLEYLERRIKTTQELHSVVRLMKSMAAASIRRNERAVEALSLHARAVELGLRALLTRHPMPLQRRAQTRVGMVCIGTDQGMCGPFNERLLELAVARRADWIAQGAAVECVVVGERLGGLVEEAQIPIAHTYRSPVSVEGARLSMRELLPLVEAWEVAAFSRVVVLYHRSRGGASWESVEVQVLPLDEHWLGSITAEPWPSRSIPSWTMDDRALYAALVRQHLIITLYRAAVESQAAENASRLAAMSAADQSIGDRLDELDQFFRSERQTSITLELLDVIGGFEALGSSQ